MKVRDDIQNNKLVTKMRINESGTKYDQLEIAEALNTYFVSIFTTEDRAHIPNIQ